MTYNLTMKNVNIGNTTGYGLMLDNLFGNSVIFNTTIALSHSTHESYAGNFAFYCSDENAEEYHTAVQHQLTISYSTFENGTNIDYHKVNASSSGVYVQVICNINISIVFDHVIIRGNQAQRGGNIGILYEDPSFLWTISISIFNSEVTCGSANIGGGIFMNAITTGTNRFLDDYERTILNIQNTTFENNSASYVGAAVYLRLHQNYNSAVGKILFKNNCTFTRNKLLITVNPTVEWGYTFLYMHCRNTTNTILCFSKLNLVSVHSLKTVFTLILAIVVYLGLEPCMPSMLAVLALEVATLLTITALELLRSTAICYFMAIIPFVETLELKVMESCSVLAL